VTESAIRTFTTPSASTRLSIVEIAC